MKTVIFYLRRSVVFMAWERRYSTDYRRGDGDNNNSPFDPPGLQAKYLYMKCGNVFISTVVVLRRHVVGIESIVVAWGFIRRMFFWVTCVVPSATVSRYGRIRVILSRLHCTIHTHNMATAILNNVIVTLSIRSVAHDTPAPFLLTSILTSGDVTLNDRTWSIFSSCDDADLVGDVTTWWRHVPVTSCFVNFFADVLLATGNLLMFINRFFYSYVRRLCFLSIVCVAVLLWKVRLRKKPTHNVNWQTSRNRGRNL